MITSDKQYTAAQKQLSTLTTSLSAPIKAGVPEVIAQASKAQLRELIEEVQHNIAEYDRLKNCDPSDIEIHSLDDLMVVPIRYRIAAHMSVDAFSRKVGVSARQIARYEMENYQNTNASTLRKILGGLNIHLNGKVV
ncbi:MAG: DNA-binding transcriptional MerR regulator [Phenylobacterium sp.]|jgi:DNA-binding transcriptional MerR regulator